MSRTRVVTLRESPRRIQRNYSPLFKERNNAYSFVLRYVAIVRPANQPLGNTAHMHTVLHPLLISFMFRTNLHHRFFGWLGVSHLIGFLPILVSVLSVDSTVPQGIWLVPAITTKKEEVASSLAIPMSCKDENLTSVVIISKNASHVTVSKRSPKRYASRRLL